jgi:hypothetical protein
MSELDVQRARFNLLQQQQARARRKSSKKIKRFSAPLLMALNLMTTVPSTQSNPTEETTEHTTDSNEISSEFETQSSEQNEQDNEEQTGGAVEADLANKLVYQQAVARNAQAIEETKEQEEQRNKVVQAQKQKEDVNRTVVRPAQHSLFTGSVLGAETVIGFILGSAAWVTWKTLELYKTVTDARMPIFDNQIVAWNAREKLEFVFAATVILFVFLLLACIACLIVYMFSNPEAGLEILPGLASIFNSI